MNTFPQPHEKAPNHIQTHTPPPVLCSYTTFTPEPKNTIMKATIKTAWRIMKSAAKLAAFFVTDKNWTDLVKDLRDTWK